MSEERKNVYVTGDVQKDAERYALEHDEKLGEFVARAIKEAMRRVPDTSSDEQEDEGDKPEAERAGK